MPSVAQLMSVDFVTVTARMPLDEAFALLVESDVSELCIVDVQDRLEGIITDYELLKASLSGDLLNRTVGDYASRSVVTVSPDLDMSRIIPLFRDGACSRVYVCRDGVLLGRVTRKQALRELLGQSAVAMSPNHRHELFRTHERNASVQQREATPRAPQFLAKTSVIGGLHSMIDG